MLAGVEPLASDGPSRRQMNGSTQPELKKSGFERRTREWQVVKGSFDLCSVDAPSSMPLTAGQLGR